MTRLFQSLPEPLVQAPPVLPAAARAHQQQDYRLDQHQRAAVETIYHGDSGRHQVIWGPPGTGKVTPCLEPTSFVKANHMSLSISKTS